MDYPLTAIISDLHSNLQALETAVADALGRGVRRFVCLGDMIGYGADPVPCLERVVALTSGAPGAGGATELVPGLCLMGNHEYALMNSAEDFNPRARAAIEWTRAAIRAGRDGAGDGSDFLWDFLGSLEPSACDGPAMFAHGSPRDPVREYVIPSDARNPQKLEAMFEACLRPVCFVGHSHVPAVYYEDQRFYRPRDTEGPYDLTVSDSMRAIVNVGSVGQPRDGDSRLSYVLFDGTRVTFVRLAYDVERAQAAIRNVGELPDDLADRLALGR
ncbi:metallophosphoesterase family protein [Engelhardtia mirabilis]|uniref:Calcineurin-like phosphoesterase superfamily domain protein n=1 Tax=Engelhardtia mirabilis TaxID=2528011 RepID=A0A518BJE7_9BACT|nr:Calcineurin-like phosphoesterase superfamily domain protein [Planctomycetes bacterium Pla133]QDV01390.1 Calcineurin-like phosphoesterase superfamily domain protein [Planctomycetes bacterium Pla86]